MQAAIALNHSRARKLALIPHRAEANHQSVHLHFDARERGTPHQVLQNCSNHYREALVGTLMQIYSGVFASPLECTRGERVSLFFITHPGICGGLSRRFLPQTGFYFKNMVISRHTVHNYLLVFQNNKGVWAKVGRVAQALFLRENGGLIENYFNLQTSYIIFNAIMWLSSYSWVVKPLALFLDQGHWNDFIQINSFSNRYKY